MNGSCGYGGFVGADSNAVTTAMVSSLGWGTGPWWVLRWGGRPPGHMSNHTRMG